MCHLNQETMVKMSDRFQAPPQELGMEGGMNVEAVYLSQLTGAFSMSFVHQFQANH